MFYSKALFCFLSLSASGITNAQSIADPNNDPNCPPALDGNSPIDGDSCTGVSPSMSCLYEPRTCIFFPGIIHYEDRCFCDDGGTLTCSKLFVECFPPDTTTDFPSSSPSVDKDPNHPMCPPIRGTTPISGDSCKGVPSSTYCQYELRDCSYSPNSYFYGMHCLCDDSAAFVCARLSISCFPPISDAPSSAPSEQPTRAVGDDSWMYLLPNWWDAVQAANGSENLKRCFKRQFPPEEGTACATRTKICYFGNQDCPVPTNGPFPATKCTCDGSKNIPGTWNCVAEACPVLY